MRADNTREVGAYNSTGGNYRRVYLVFFLLALAMVLLAGRLAWWVRTDPNNALARERTQQRRVIPQSGKPGSILARSHSRYVLLTGSKQVPSCYVDPGLIDEKYIANVSLRVGEALGINPLDSQEIIVSRRGRRFAYLKRGITPREVEAVSKLRLASVGITHEWRRYYPCGRLASSVVGFRYNDGKPGGGLESSLQRYLQPEDGRRVVFSDAARRPILLDSVDSIPPRDGYNVMLCLDAVIQGYLQEAVGEAVEKFGAKWGVGVAVDPFSGEVFAMCTMPTFDPAKFNDVPASQRTNRVICTPYEPGSVMKPIYASAAVDCGKFNYKSKIFCENGSYRARRGGTISDHHSYGTLSLTDVVVHSSNIGMAKVGEKMGNRRLFEVAGKFGFGEKSGIRLPGESRGIVRPLNKWDGYSTRRVPFGHEISVTSLQLTMAFCALANGGELLRPRIIDHISTVGGDVRWRNQRQVVRRVISPQTAASTLKVMRQVVQRGTGRSCRLKLWTSFGKTGTAQIPGQGGYVEDAYAGTFVGGAPASKPRVLCMITIYWPERAKGYYGGTVAAPYVKKVLQKTLVYLDVPPDK